ncbi:hypothetical protein GQ457_08G023830 [Hibiscus cannabinus]
MSMEEHIRVIPSEVDILRNELEATRVKMEKIEVQHERDLYLAKVEVDKFAGEVEQAMKKILEAENLAEDRQRNWDEQEIEKEKERRRYLVESEKTKVKQIIEQYQQALEAEKDNVVAWKQKSHDSKIRLTESQSAYNSLKIHLNQSHAQYIQLEARVREQEDMISEYQTRYEYTELQASWNKIETLEKEVKDLWALVQTCQISIHVLEDIKKEGNDYWFTRLRDAAHRF